MLKAFSSERSAARSAARASLGLAVLAGPLALATAAHARPWEVTVGGNVSTRPRYESSDRYNISPAPTFSIHPAKRYHRFSPPGDGTTISLIETRRISIGPMARFRSSRGSGGDFVGFNKVQWAAEPGGFIDLWPTDWLRARVEIRRGIRGHQGWVGDAGLDLVYSGGKWDASIGPRVGFGDQNYMNTYFGVTPAEAARSPFIDTAFTPKEGRRYTGLSAGIAYHFDRHWKTTLTGGYQHLADNLARSPIVIATGSQHQYLGGIAVSYSFQVGR